MAEEYAFISAPEGEELEVGQRLQINNGQRVRSAVVVSCELSGLYVVRFEKEGRELLDG